MITIVWIAAAFIMLGLAELAGDKVARSNIRLLTVALIGAGIGVELALAYQLPWPGR